MDSLDDLVARERRIQDVAVRAAGTPERTYTYHRFCTTAWKTGNFLRHLGVGEGVAVGVAADPLPQPLLTFFGTALLGGRTRFAPPTDWDGRVVVAGGDATEAYDLPPGGQRVAYGDDPDDPATRYFEQDVWSENPSFPPVDRDPTTPALDDGNRTYSPADLVGAATRVADGFDLGEEVVAVRASLTDARVLTAGVLAPLIAGGTVLFPGEEAVGDVAVIAAETADDPPEQRVMPVDAVSL
jgi:hypothetical protein